MKLRKTTYREHTDDQCFPRNDESVLCCSFDLQAVLATPHIDSVLLFYTRKYATCNFTVYDSISPSDIASYWVKLTAGEAQMKSPHVYTSI